MRLSGSSTRAMSKPPIWRSVMPNLRERSGLIWWFRARPFKRVCRAFYCLCLRCTCALPGRPNTIEVNRSGYWPTSELADQPGAVASITKWRGRADTPSMRPEKYVRLSTAEHWPSTACSLRDGARHHGQPGDVELLAPIASYDEMDPGPMKT